MPRTHQCINVMSRILFLIAFAACAWASTPELVTLKVVVRDQHGPVEGLAASDFAIYDRGKPCAIDFFSVQTGFSKLTGEVVLVNEGNSWRVDDELADVVMR